MKNKSKSGSVIKPEKYRGWTVDVMDDSDFTGGFYLFIYSETERRGFEDWFFNIDQVNRQIASANMEVDWIGK